MKRLYPAVAGVFLFSTTALTTSPQVQAFQSAPMGEPLAVWRIGSVQARSEGRPAYCAMVNQFSNGAVLAFARNAEGTGSLAVDFRRDMFESGGDYEVTLKVDKDVERQFAATANSGRSIVIQTGGDSELFRALARNGELAVMMPRAAFTFSLDHFAQSYVQMGGCLETIGASLLPAAKADMDAVVQAGTVSLDTQEAALNERLEIIRQEEARLSDEWAALRASQGVKGEDIDKEMEALEKARRDVTRLKDDLARKEKEFKARQSRHEAEEKRLQAQFEELQKIQRRAVDTVIYDEKSSRELREIEKTLKEEQSVLDKMAAELDAIVKKEEKDPSAAVLDAALKRADLENGITAQKEVVAALKSEQKRLKKTVKTPQENKTREVVKLLEVERDQLLKLKIQAEKATRNKREELEAAHAQVAVLEKKVQDEKYRHEEELASLKQKTRTAGLASKTHNLPEKQKDLTRREALLEERMRAHAKAVAALEIEKTELKAHRAARAGLASGGVNGADIAIYTEQIAALKSKVAEKDTKIAALEESVAALSDTSNQALLEEANAEIAALQEKLEDLEQDVAVAGKDKDMMRDEVAILRDKYATQTVNLQTAMTEIKTLKLVRDEQRGHIETLQADLASAEERYASEMSAHKRTREQVANLTREKTEFGKELETVKAQLNAYQASEELASRWKDGRFSKAQVYQSMPEVQKEKKGLLGRLTGKTAKPEKISSAVPVVETEVDSDMRWPEGPALNVATVPVFPQKLEAMLEDAGVPLVALLPTENTPDGQQVIYKWSTGRLVGMLKQTESLPGKNFDARVAATLAEYRQQCGNNVEVSLGSSRAMNGMFVSSADIICRNNGGVKFASMLFYDAAGVFTLVSHEGNMSDRQDAMRLRDDIAAVMTHPLDLLNRSEGQKYGMAAPVEDVAQLTLR